MSRMPVNSEIERIDNVINNEILEATKRDMLFNNVKRYIRNKWSFKLSDDERRIGLYSRKSYLINVFRYLSYVIPIEYPGSKWEMLGINLVGPMNYLPYDKRYGISL
ncbi:hypothetical protein A3Q56_08694, partial [Intoshia linei]